MNARLQVKVMRLGHLLPLSVVNASKGVPRPATNEERIKLLRPLLPTPTYNEFTWPFASRKQA